MIHVVATSVALPQYLAEYRQSLEALIAPTRREQGCLLYDLHQNLHNPAHFIFYEIWQSQAMLDAHTASDHLLAHRTRSVNWIESSEYHVLERIG